MSRLALALIALTLSVPASASESPGLHSALDRLARDGKQRLQRALVSLGGSGITVERRGLDYPAYPVGTGIRYVPGLDAYLSGGAGGRLRWLSLYEDFEGALPARRR